MVNSQLHNAGRDYYHTRLCKSSSQKEVYQVADDLIFGGKNTILPSSDSIPELVERFSEYFTSKIQDLRDNLDKQVSVTSAKDSFSPDVKHILTEFTPATQEEIRRLIKKCASKSCDLDPIPTWLLKLCLDELVPCITHIVNLSLSTSEVPSKLKLALIVPLIKKLLLDPEVLKARGQLKHRLNLPINK